MVGKTEPEAKGGPSAGSALTNRGPMGSEPDDQN